MPRYLISFDDGSMDRIPDGDGAAVADASHAVVREAKAALTRFDAPTIASDHRTAPVNSLGYLRVMFAVDDVADTIARLGATEVDEIVEYEGVYRLCYLRGPEGILIGPAQRLA